MPGENEHGQAGSGNLLLPKLLRDSRERKQLKQSELARSLDVSSSHISYFENGTRQPSIAQLAVLAPVLGLKLEGLVLARCADDVVRTTIEEWPEGSDISREDLISRLKGRVRNCDEVAPVSKTSGRTFMDFPEAFGNIVIVTGDKREEKPKNAGDIGAYSASPIDDRWIWMLKGLNAETEKVSDKEFVISNEARLRKKYGNRTLLVVGSPASNHLARIVNRQAVFRFNFHSQFAKEIEDIVSNIKHLRDFAILEQVKLANLDKLKSIMRKFYSYGIVDPVKGDVNGFAAAPDRDFATITFANNPYSEPSDLSHPAIIVAGFHLPGTTHALKCLGLFRRASAEEELSFAQHPYGGVLEIKFNPELQWEDRMLEQVEYKWETSEYSIGSLRAGLQGMIGKRTALLDVNDEDIAACLKLIEGL